MLVTDLALKMAPNLTLKTAPTRRVGTRQVVIPHPPLLAAACKWQLLPAVASRFP